MKGMTKFLIAIPIGILFGKLLPVILLGAIFLGLAVIVKAALAEADK